MDLVCVWYDDRHWSKILLSTIPNPMHDITGPDSSVGRVSAPGTGGHGFDPGPRHTKVVKNGTSCSSLGTQIYEVELGLVDPVSG